MKCPFCAEEVNDEAVVCRHCRHDLTVVSRLSKQLAEALAASPPTEMKRAELTGSKGWREQLARKLRDRSLPIHTTIVVAILAIVVVHFLVIVELDLSIKRLRVSTALLALLFGFITRLPNRHAVLALLIGTLIVALFSVFAMFGTVALLFPEPLMLLHQPVQPEEQDEWRAEWRSFIEWTVSLGMAFVSGATCRWLLQRYAGPLEVPGRDASSKTSSPDLELAEKSLKSVEALLASVAAIGTMVISLMTALSH